MVISKLPRGGAGGEPQPTIITLTLEGAKEDTINIKKANGELVQSVVFPAESTTETVLLPIEDGKEYIFESTVAKALDGSGNNYAKNVTLTSNNIIGGYSIKNLCAKAFKVYSTLNSIPLEDMKHIMKKHASADYFVDWYNADNSMLSQFTINENAMKAIGLSDYLADKLFEIPTAKEELLSSTYWEYILKDKVPTMTSDTTPEGEAFVTNTVSESSAYKAFDNDITKGCISAMNPSNWYVGYKFINPICVKKAKVISTTNSPKRYKIQASNDNTTWTDVSGIITETDNANVNTIVECNNDNYYLYYRIYVIEGFNPAQFRVYILQFYGRSLNVSVPKMTSATTPSGEVSASSFITDVGRAYEPYLAFNDNAIGWHCADDDINNPWIQYNFNKDVVIRYAEAIVSRAKGDFSYTYDIALFGGNSEANLINLNTTVAITSTNKKAFSNVENPIVGKYIRGYVTSNNIHAGEGLKLQFYGVDYSEPADVKVIPDGALEWYGNQVVPMDFDPRNWANGWVVHNPTIVRNTNSFSFTLDKPNTANTVWNSMYATKDKIDISGFTKLKARIKQSAITSNAHVTSQAILIAYNAIATDYISNDTSRKAVAYLSVYDTDNKSTFTGDSEIDLLSYTDSSGKLGIEIRSCTSGSSYGYVSANEIEAIWLE